MVKATDDHGARQFAVFVPAHAIGDRCDKGVAVPCAAADGAVASLADHVRPYAERILVQATDRAAGRGSFIDPVHKPASLERKPHKAMT
jgi:hypothetical protein